MKKIVIAPNAFKHTLTATEAAEAIRDGLIDAGIEATFILHPVGDGGDGTGELLIRHLHGTVIDCNTEDALGRPLRTSYGLLPGSKTAIIEMARASGISLLQPTELNPLRASSYGTGILFREALNREVSEVILTVGGSATVDGGTGILRAVGTRFFDESEKELTSITEMATLHRIDTSQLHPRLLQATIKVLCDVRNSLCGSNGAAAVFGPQKGASPAMVKLLDNALNRLAFCIRGLNRKKVIDVKYGGAAGGVAAGLYGLLGARLLNGIDEFLALTGFEEIVRGAAGVITGEGRLDRQTLEGKAPLGVAKFAQTHGVPVVCLAGEMAEPDSFWTPYFTHVYACSPPNQPRPTPTEARSMLYNRAKSIAASWLP